MALTSRLLVPNASLLAVPATRTHARRALSWMRPAMVTEYGKRGAERLSAQWQLFRVVTWVATAGE